jgi:hypothetical protein
LHRTPFLFWGLNWGLTAYNKSQKSLRLGGAF